VWLVAGLADGCGRVRFGDAARRIEKRGLEFVLEATPGTGTDEMRACLVTSRGITIRVSLLGVLAGGFCGGACCVVGWCTITPTLNMHVFAG
jgi:hypothetical protein